MSNYVEQSNLSLLYVLVFVLVFACTLWNVNHMQNIKG